MYHVFSTTSSIIETNATATGSIPADTILVNCSLVNVYTREIQENIQISIKNDRIAYVGPNAIHTKGKKTSVIDIKKKFVTPSFADPHIHIDHFTLPSEFIKKSLLNNEIFFYPASYRRAYQFEETENANVILRAEVLNKLNNKRNPIIITYAEALSEKVINRRTLKRQTILLKKGMKTIKY